MRASGLTGELRVGYQQAAALGRWSMALLPRLPRAYAFRAEILSEHAYWITQTPLDLALAVGSAEWVWRGVTPTHDGDSFTIELRDRPIVSDRALAHKEQER